VENLPEDGEGVVLECSKSNVVEVVVVSLARRDGRCDKFRLENWSVGVVSSTARELEYLEDIFSLADL
jgi:hypothetical protein